MAGFTDYAEVPGAPGAYSFMGPGGAGMTMSGQAAQQEIARINALRGLQRPTAPLPGSAEQLMSPAPAPEERMSRAPEPNRGLGTPYHPIDIDALPEPPKAPVVGQLKGGGKMTIAPGSDQLMIQEPRRAATPGGMIPTTTTIAGGKPASQDYVEQQIEAHIDEQLANQRAYQATMKAAAVDHGVMQAQADSLKLRAIEAQRQQALISKQVDEKQAIRDKASMELASARVDPKAAIVDNPLSIIGLMLGTLASNFPGAKRQAPNYAMDMLNHQIESSIRAQEADIAVKREGANNALQDLQSKLGSQELARGALSTILHEQAQTNIELAKSQANNELQAAQLDKLSALNEQALSDKLEKYRQDSVGVVTQNLKFQPPQAGSAGGARFATPQEQKAWLEIEDAKAKIGATKAGIEETQAKTAAIKTKQQAAGKNPLSPAQEQQFALIDAGRKALLQHEAVLNEEPNSRIYNTGFAASAHSQRAGQSAQSAADAIARARAGGGRAASPEIRNQLAADLVSTSLERRKQAIQMNLRQLDNMAEAIRSHPGAAPEPATAGESEE